MMKHILILLKGIAMGAANVIPGVSGGTVALVTGIYERLIVAVGNFNLGTLKLLLSGKLKEFAEKTDLVFIITLLAGIGIAIVGLAGLLKHLLCNYEINTLGFFFGLIIASVVLVAKQLDKWNSTSIIMLVIGLVIAVGISFLNPASSNSNFWYLVICGIVAISSMVLPGLSGSYVLLLMGNYILIMSAISKMNFDILLPVALGSIVGLLLFVKVISFLLKNFKDGTIALLLGFVFGSLLIIWPWKNTIYKINASGEVVNKKLEVVTDACKDGVVMSYERYMPDMNGSTFLTIGIIIVGVGAVLLLEKYGSKIKEA